MRGASRERRLLADHLPAAMATTLAVTLVPALLVAGLRSVGVVSSWALGVGVASSLSLLIGAAGSAWWVRRPASRDIVFADLMLWGWWRRRRTERRLAKATWLLGRVDGDDRDNRAQLLEEMSATLEARDPYTHGHSKRVTRHAHMIARAMGLPPEQAARVRTAAALHDVGKARTPRDVLNKPGGLTDDEFAIIKRHPVDGAEMVAGLGDPEVVAIIRHHHERLDGGGYPDGLSGAEIPLGARIIAVADTFDALTSTRPYRSGCRHKKALDILRKEAGAQLDPRAVAAFLRYYAGRRSIPGWAAVAATPPRLGAWLSSAVNSVGSAPLGGAAALGAGFLVSGALVVPPLTSQMASAASIGFQPVSQDRQAAAESVSEVPGGSSRGERPRSRTGEGRRRSGAVGAREGRERPDHADGGARPGRPDSGPAGGGGSGRADGPVAGEGVSGDRSSGGASNTGDGGLPGGDPGGGSGGGLGLPDVERPAPPGVELPSVEVPPVRIPPVEAPPVEVGPVEVPGVQLPPVQLPPVQLPPVRVPPL